MGYEKLFLNASFQRPIPKILGKIGAFHNWSGTEKLNDPPRPSNINNVGTKKECGQRFNEKCLRVIVELQRNIDHTLMRVESRKDKHKIMYPLEKDIFVSNNGRVKKKTKLTLRSATEKRQRKTARECS